MPIMLILNKLAIVLNPYIAYKKVFKAFLMDKKVYNRIKAVLAEKGKTNLWLADELKMNKNTVSKWCRNEIQPTMETLFAIADALDVDVKELLVSNKKGNNK